jgi:hypothetical protein
MFHRVWRVASLIWPVLVLFALSIVLWITNYLPEHWLLGWDNTAPELNLALNWERFLFPVWQEYRGLGTLDGMAHGANIVHWLYVWILRWVLAAQQIRWAVQLGLHFLGGLGLYFLLSESLLPLFSSSKAKPAEQRIWQQVAALVASGVYLLNFMTIQMFYQPLELFTYHFAAIPWGIWSLKKFLVTPTKRNLAFVFIINLVFVSQAHVPTIFIPYALVLGLFLLFHWLGSPLKHLKSSILVGFVLICINTFWGLPYLYTATHKSPEIANSKQYRLGTPSIFYRNFAWSDTHALATFGGFQIDYIDWNNQEAEFQQTLQPWLQLYNSQKYQGLTYAISILSIIGVGLGVWATFRRKTVSYLPYISGWLLAVFMLGVNIPVVGAISAFLRDTIPFFFQIFRFTFTKFAFIYVFFVSCWVAIAVYQLGMVFEGKKWVRRGWRAVVSGSAIAALAVISYPAFQGHFFYSALEVEVPPAYFQLFDFLDTNYSSRRLVTLPIHSLWGWTTGTHQWGYRGSGFTWQAIRQPMVDRSFDPWSALNETMYLQLSQAVYTQDSRTFQTLLRKYHSSLLFLDKSIFHPGNYQENLYTPEIKQLLSETTRIDKVAEFGSAETGLELYNADTSGHTLQLFSPTRLTLVHPSYVTKYTNRDQAYLDYGDYIQLPSNSSVAPGTLEKEPAGVVYPFSQYQAEKLATTPTITNEGWWFTLPASDHHLIIPDFTTSQTQVMSVITAWVNPQKTDLYLLAEVQLPVVTPFRQFPAQLPQTVLTIPLASLRADRPITLVFNQAETNFSLDEISAEPKVLLHGLSGPATPLQLAAKQGTKNLAAGQISPQTIFTQNAHQLALHSPTQPQSIFISTGYRGSFISQPLTAALDAPARNCQKQQLGSITKSKSSETLTYTAKDRGIICDELVFPELDPELEYVFHWRGQTVSGTGLRALLVNPETKRFDIDTISPAGAFDEWYPLYPSRKRDFEQLDRAQSGSFFLTLQGETFNTESNTVEVNELSLTPLPLRWLGGIRIESSTPPLNNVVPLVILKEQRFSPYHYETRVLNNSSHESYLVLPQGYDQAWVALAYRQDTKWWQPVRLPHLIYNGWGNVWEVPAGEWKVVLLFWPQLLSWVGYGLLILSGSVVALLAFKEKSSQKGSSTSAAEKLAKKPSVKLSAAARLELLFHRARRVFEA